MKHFCLILFIALLSACGNGSHSDIPNNLSQADFANARSGLQVTIKNSLPEEQIGSNRVRPNLNAYFCSPLPTSSGSTPKTTDRCIRLNGVVKNGSTETFLVSKADLESIYNRGFGKGAFEFADDQQLTSIPWNCYSPNDQVDLDSNFDSKQTWFVEVTQRYSFSYGCLTQRN